MYSYHFDDSIFSSFGNYYYSLFTTFEDLFLLENYQVAELPYSDVPSKVMTVTAANAFINSYWYVFDDDRFFTREYAESIFNASILFRVDINSRSNPTNTFTGF